MSRTASKPRARNHSAHRSLENYFQRVYQSLADRDAEFRQMKKYVRVFEEAQMLLQVEQTLNVAADRIFEIDINSCIRQNDLLQLVKTLQQGNTSLKSYLKGKPYSQQIQLLHELTGALQKLMQCVLHLNQHLQRINEVIPLLKALLTMQESESGDIAHDSVLAEISQILKEQLDEPALNRLKELLVQRNVNFQKFDSNLHYEHLNDVSDKLIGLLNDKLLVVISVSEILVEGIEDDGTHDVGADQRLPDELRVLFLASCSLDILRKIVELQHCLNTAFDSVRDYMAIMKNPQLDQKIRQSLTNGKNRLHDRVVQLVKHLRQLSPAINPLAEQVETLDVHTAIQLTYSLVYEKSRRVWENPYQIPLDFATLR